MWLDATKNMDPNMDQILKWNSELDQYLFALVLYDKWIVMNVEAHHRHVNTHQVLIIQRWAVHQSKWDACLSSSEGLREKEEKGCVATV